MSPTRAKLRSVKPEDGEPVAVVGRCGARLRGGRRCREESGANTDHPGTGPCWRHDETAVTKAGSGAGAMESSGELMAPGTQPGDIVQVEGHHAMVWSVWLAAGDVAFWQNYLKDLPNNPELNTVDVQMEAFEQLRRANKEMRQAAKSALDAGLSERHIQLAERMAGILSQFGKELANNLQLTPDQMDMLPNAINKALVQLEAPIHPTMNMMSFQG